MKNDADHRFHRQAPPQPSEGRWGSSHSSTCPLRLTPSKNAALGPLGVLDGWCFVFSGLVWWSGHLVVLIPVKYVLRYVARSTHSF